VRVEAAQRGFEREQRPLRGQWGRRRGDDTQWPCFLTEREAVSSRTWADRLRRTTVFER
jgi:hypothetical protein